MMTSGAIAGINDVPQQKPVDVTGDPFFLPTPPVTAVIANVHLTSGEDIIGTVTEVHGKRSDATSAYVITKPVLPNVRFDPAQGKFHVGLLPLRPYLGQTETVTIPADRVIYVIPVNESMEDLYRNFTSNITVVSSMPDDGAPMGRTDRGSIILR
jgi:hypothetical protein